MTLELAQKTEEIRCYHAEQVVVINQIRELVGYPGEIVNKAHLYDKLIETVEVFPVDEGPVKGNSKAPAPVRTPKADDGFRLAQITYGWGVQSGRRGGAHPTAQATPRPSQAAGASRQHESGKALDRKRTLEPERVRSPPIWRKSTDGSTRSGRVQSLMPDRAQL